MASQESREAGDSQQYGHQQGSHAQASHLNHTQFNLPILNGDGSPLDCCSTYPSRGYQTPPAALSSLGAKMAQKNDVLTDSVNSIDDGSYDMVDDASEISTDDHETASLASSTHDFTGEEDDNDEEGQMTPEEAASVIDIDDAHNETYAGVEPLEELQGVHAYVDDHEQLQLHDIQDFRKFPLGYTEPYAITNQKTQEYKDLFESNTSEDLETPRQSTIGATYMATEGLCPATQVSSISSRHKGVKIPISARLRSKQLESSSRSAKPFFSVLGNFSWTACLAVLLFLCSWTTYEVMTALSADPVAEVAIRREALSAALVDLVGSPDAAKQFNTTHIVPMPDAVSTEFFGLVQLYATHTVPFQGAPPNHIVFSLPMSTSGSYPILKTARVLKSEHDVAFNQTRLIKGVYAIAVDPSEAYGIVTVNLLCKHPVANITVSHNFGSRMLQLKTYENARTDISKSITKEVAIARKAAQTLSERVHQEVVAGMAATRNVTNQLAIYMARDLQIVTNTAVCVMGKAASASNKTADIIRKDLVLFQHGIVKAGNDVRDLMTTATDTVKSLMPSKEQMQQPLLLSRERALMLSDRFIGRKVVSHPSHHTAEPDCKDAGSYLARKKCTRDAKYASKAAERESKKAKHASKLAEHVSKRAERSKPAQPTREASLSSKNDWSSTCSEARPGWTSCVHVRELVD